MNKYFNKKNPYNGEIITQLFMDLYNKNNYTNILFIRTNTTGAWLDNILKSDNTIIRILYDTKKTKKIPCHKSTIIIDSNELENTIKNLNKKFDIICVDPFHEYETSLRDLLLASACLTDEGILLCHDCFPSNISLSAPKYKLGSWCGVTYIAFVEFAYQNPNWFYGVLSIDTGIGIMSKKYIDQLTNNFDKLKQEKIINMNKNNEPDIYNYYCMNSKDLINLLYLDEE